MSAQDLILVPLDGSAVSEEAVPIAVDLARRTGAPLHLVHVHVPITADPIHVEGLAVIDENMRSLRRDHEQAYLDQVREEHARGAVAAAILLDGPVAATVASYGQANHARLIVMTTHGRSGLERAWLGSVADELVRISPVPLLLVPPGSASAVRPLRRVLVPLDGSAVAESILEHAIGLARIDADSELILLDVVQPIASAVWVPDVVPRPEGGDDVTRRQEERAREYLARLSSRLETSRVRVHARVRVATTVAPAILEVARDEQADIIALATHGRSGIKRLTMGSVADKVVRGSPVPVLLFRPHTTQAPAG
jgi:nucleotide-binding universal stress UspA family protein